MSNESNTFDGIGKSITNSFDLTVTNLVVEKDALVKGDLAVLGNTNFGNISITNASVDNLTVNDLLTLNNPLPIASGGTGLTSVGPVGQVLTSTGTGLQYTSAGAGSVIGVTASSPLSSSGGSNPNISVGSSTGSGAIVLQTSPTIISPLTIQSTSTASLRTSSAAFGLDIEADGYGTTNNKRIRLLADTVTVSNSTSSAETSNYFNVSIPASISSTYCSDFLRFTNPNNTSSNSSQGIAMYTYGNSGTPRLEMGINSGTAWPITSSSYFSMADSTGAFDVTFGAGNVSFSTITGNFNATTLGAGSIELNCIGAGAITIGTAGSGTVNIGCQGVGALNIFTGLGEMSISSGGLLFISSGGSTLITASTLIVSAGSTNINGTFSVNGISQLTGNLNVTGLAQLQGNLNVTGTSSFQGNVTLIGAIEGGTAAFGNSTLISLEVIQNSLFGGNVSVLGSFTAFGTSIFSGALSITGGLTVSGFASIQGGANIAGGLGIQGGANILGAVGIQGGVEIAGATNINGAVGVQGIVNVTGSVAVQGPVSTTGALVVGGVASLNGATNILGLLTCQGSVNIIGTNITALVGGIDLAGVYANLTCTTGNIGIASGSGAVKIAADSGGVSIGGNGNGYVANFEVKSRSGITTFQTGNISFVIDKTASEYGPGNFSINTISAAIGDMYVTTKGIIAVSSNSSPYAALLNTSYITGSSYTWNFPSTAGALNSILLSGAGSGAMTWLNPGSTGTFLSSNGTSLSWQSFSSTVNWASPGAIGSTTPNTGAFTTLSASAANTVFSSGVLNVQNTSTSSGAVASLLSPNLSSGNATAIIWGKGNGNNEAAYLNFVYNTTGSLVSTTWGFGNGVPGTFIRLNGVSVGEQITMNGNIGLNGSISLNGQISSTWPDGTPPFTVVSTTLVTNLNVGRLLNATWAVPGTIGSTTPSTGSFTTLSASGVITSTQVTGTPPFSITSTTVVPNLNVSQLLGSTWAVPGTIGSTTPSTGSFTTLAASGVITSTQVTGTPPFSITSTTVVPNLNVSQLLGSTWAVPGTIGSTTPSTGAFTTLSASASNSVLTSGVLSITNTSTLSGAAATFFTPSIASGNVTQILLGRSNLSNEGAYLSFTYNTTTSLISSTWGFANSTPTNSISLVGDGSNLINGPTTINSRLTSTLATGTAPFSITSTTVVPNLNVSQLLGATWVAPGAIGSTTRSTGAFTTLAASGVITSTQATGTSPFAITSTTVVPNLNVSQLLGSTWVSPGTIGSTTRNTGAFTTLSASAANAVFTAGVLNVTNTTTASGAIAYLVTPSILSGNASTIIWGKGNANSEAAYLNFVYNTTGTLVSSTWGFGNSVPANFIRLNGDGTNTINGTVSVTGGISFTGQIISSLVTGTAPFSIASTTVVPNLNVSQLLGSTWVSPGAIGATTPNFGAFSSLSTTGQIVSTLASGTAPFALISTTVVPNLNVSQLLGSTWEIPGAIGNTTRNTGAFTNLSAFSSSSIFTSGVLNVTNTATVSSSIATFINPNIASGNATNIIFGRGFANNEATYLNFAYNTTAANISATWGFGNGVPGNFIRLLGDSTILLNGRTAIQNSSTATNFASTMLMPSLTASAGGAPSRAELALGVSLSTANCGIIDFDYYNSGDTTNNTIGLGFFGSNNCFLVNSNGVGYIGTRPASIGNGNGAFNFGTNTTNGGQWCTFYDGTTPIGSIFRNGLGGTTFSTTSDYRLKSDIQESEDTLPLLLKLKPVTFIHQVSKEKIRATGFIAHEVQEIIPNLITGKKDAVKENGVPDYQQIDYAAFAPYLVKAIQTLENRIKVLESK